jgi:uncharacterized protein (TIGR00159 family)
MLEGVLTYITERKLDGLLRDFLDIAIVYYAFYRALLVMRGTRAVQVGVGLATLLAVYVVARLLELVTVLTVMSVLLSSLLLIIVVVFQNDIRRGLQRIGSQAIFSKLTRGPETRVIDEVVEAATELARHRIGALITFEQDANLDEFVGVHKGHLIDAAVSRELLVSLFVPEGVNKLHDGAVIIRNLRIAKAGVFFPMPEQRIVDASFGSRHRAALGITEETDAVVVIVSEERGTISFCFNGNIVSNLDGPKLRTLLEAVFSPKLVQKRAAKRAGATSADTATASPEPPATATSNEEIGIRGRSADATRSPVPSSRSEAITSPQASADLSPMEAERLTPFRRGLESEPPPPLRRGLESEPPPRRGLESEPPPRRGLESEPPPPLRSRNGLEPANVTRSPRSTQNTSKLRPPLVPRDASILHTPVTKATEGGDAGDSDKDKGEGSP